MFKVNNKNITTSFFHNDVHKQTLSSKTKTQLDFLRLGLMIHGRHSAGLKTSKKNYETMFFDLEKYVFNTMHIEIKHKCEKNLF